MNLEIIIIIINRSSQEAVGVDDGCIQGPVCATKSDLVKVSESL